MRLPSKLLLWAYYVTIVKSSCYEPSPAFPVPIWKHGIEQLSAKLGNLDAQLNEIASADKYDATSYSVEISTGVETIWSRFHTASKFNHTRPGDRHVDQNSVYRIASISKLFTTLAILRLCEAGKMTLDDPISKYVPDLAGEIPWNDITLRALASQLSGIPREFAQGDLLNDLSDPTAFGLPPPSRKDLPTCDEYHNYEPPCNRNDLIQHLTKHHPVFAPNQKSTYSNINYELLGLAIEKVTATNYTEHIHSTIFTPLNMTSSTFTPPPDTHAVLPLGHNYWDVDAGIQNPTGGIYTSSADMSKFLRYVLRNYNAIHTGVNWFMPGSWSEGIQTFYSMPFEIFRSDAALGEERSKRPVTFVTKSGGLPAYYSLVTMLPEYDLGITILVAGEVSMVKELQELISVTLVRAAEDVIWRHVDETYTGKYIAQTNALNSSFELVASPSRGLRVESFISNGTDALAEVFGRYFIGDSERSWHAQVTPTLLFKNESAKRGEIWRIRGVFERIGERRGVWDEFCSADVDVVLYDGLPVGEVVFWLEEGVIELPAWDLRLKRQVDGRGNGGFVVQR